MKSAELSGEQGSVKRFAEGEIGTFITAEFISIRLAANWSERCNGEENVCVRSEGYPPSSHFCCRSF